MPRLVSFVMTSLDGYHETVERSLAWANLADDFHDYSTSQFNDMGTLLFGRVTYEGMVAYWDSQVAAETQPETRRRMREIPKVVFSTTLDAAGWAGTTLERDAVAAVTRLKEAGSGGDLVVFGSSALTARLLEAGLVDEVRATVMPTLLGEGRSLFRGLSQPVDMQLLRATTFASGNLLLSYRPVPSGPSSG